MLGGIGDRRRKGRQRMRWLDGITDSMDVSLIHPLLLFLSVFHCIRVFPKELINHIRWPKHWSFNFNISPYNEYSGLISFRIDLFDLLAVQGTPKRLFQHHNLKASVLWHSAFFMVQLSHPHVTTGKTIAFTDLCWQSNVFAF